MDAAPQPRPRRPNIHAAAQGGSKPSEKLCRALACLMVSTDSLHIPQPSHRACLCRAVCCGITMHPRPSEPQRAQSLAAQRCRSSHRSSSNPLHHDALARSCKRRSTLGTRQAPAAPFQARSSARRTPTRTSGTLRVRALRSDNSELLAGRQWIKRGASRGWRALARPVLQHRRPAADRRPPGSIS